MPFVFQKTVFSGPVEFVPHFRPRPDISCVLFDFDGTLSLIRSGWIEVMLPMFLELLPVNPGVAREADRQMLRDDIMELNGKQTVYQMIRLTERIAERGGRPEDPLRYKHEYLRRLELTIRPRIEALREGSCREDEYLLFGARRLLESLKALELPLYLASGTDEIYVKREAELLGIAEYFDERIYGARDDYRSFSKQKVLERILREQDLTGETLLSFGDGYVETQVVSRAGGLAVAVASDEERQGTGKPDPWKHRRLLDVGAEVVIPDYRDGERLIAVLLGRDRAVLES